MEGLHRVADSDGDGKVGPDDLAKFLASSKLPQSILAKVRILVYVSYGIRYGINYLMLVKVQFQEQESFSYWHYA